MPSHSEYKQKNVTQIEYFYAAYFFVHTTILFSPNKNKDEILNDLSVLLQKREYWDAELSNKFIKHITNNFVEQHENFPTILKKYILRDAIRHRCTFNESLDTLLHLLPTSMNNMFIDDLSFMLFKERKGAYIDNYIDYLIKTKNASQIEPISQDLINATHDNKPLLTFTKHLKEKQQRRAFAANKHKEEKEFLLKLKNFSRYTMPATFLIFFMVMAHIIRKDPAQMNISIMSAISLTGLTLEVLAFFWIMYLKTSLQEQYDNLVYKINNELTEDLQVAIKEEIKLDFKKEPKKITETNNNNIVQEFDTQIEIKPHKPKKGSSDEERLSDEESLSSDESEKESIPKSIPKRKDIIEEDELGTRRIMYRGSTITTFWLERNFKINVVISDEGKAAFIDSFKTAEFGNSGKCIKYVKSRKDIDIEFKSGYKKYKNFSLFAQKRDEVYTVTNLGHALHVKKSL